MAVPAPGRPRLCALLLTLALLGGCAPYGQSAFQASYPVRAGHEPAEPVSAATLALDGMQVQVRYYGLIPGPDAKCYNAVVGVIPGPVKPEARLVLTGKTGRQFSLPLTTPASSLSRESVHYLTVPANEQLVKATLRYGFLSTSADL